MAHNTAMLIPADNQKHIDDPKNSKCDPLARLSQCGVKSFLEVAGFHFPPPWALKLCAIDKDCRCTRNACL